MTRLLSSLLVLLALLGAAAPAARAQSRPGGDDPKAQARYDSAFREGIDHLEKREFEEAVACFEKAISIDPSEPDAYYNIACAFSLQGEKAKAVEWLERSLDKGFKDADHIDKDSDLDGIRGDARFLDLMARRFGRAKPGESLKTLKGDVASLEKLKGKVVIVCFWRTWVEPCKSEMATLNELQRAWGDKGLVIVAISNEDAQVQEQVADEAKASYTLLRQVGPLPEPMANVHAFPTKFILDKDGKVVKRLVAERDRAELEALVKPLIEGKKSEPEVF